MNSSNNSLEIIGPRFTVDESFEKRTDILPDELGFRQSLDTEFTEYAYVIHDMEYRRSLETIFSYFQTNPSFRLLGRWGTWNYKNMDLCMLDAMNMAKELSKG